MLRCGAVVGARWRIASVHVEVRGIREGRNTTMNKRMAKRESRTARIKDVKHYD